MTDVRNIFDGIKKDFTTYHGTVNTILSQYKKDCERDAKTYQEEIIKTRKTEHQAEAREALLAADKALQAVVGGKVDQLEQKLTTHTMQAPAGDFMDTLKVFSEFGVTMTANDLTMLKAKAGGNYLSLKALASVAEKFSLAVDVPDAAYYHNDLTRLRGAIKPPIMYPADYAHEAAEVMENRPGWSDKVMSLSVSLASHEELVKNGLDKMAEAWSD